jgi:hypothetical protein
MEIAVPFISFLAVIFYALALGSSNGEEQETMQSYWAKTTSTINNTANVNDVYYGLKSFVTDNREAFCGGVAVGDGHTTTTEFDDSTDSDCKDTWESTIGLLSIALFLAIVVTFFSLCHQINVLDFAFLKWVCLFAALFSAVFGAAGYGVWLDNCYPEIKDSADSDSLVDVDTYIGPGAVGGAIGWIFMTAVFFLQLYLNPIYSCNCSVACSRSNEPTVK